MMKLQFGFCSKALHSSDIVMSSEMFHLEWDHFRENLISSIKNLKEKDFSDVFLACEDGQVREKSKDFLMRYCSGDVTQIGSCCQLPLVPRDAG